jgi:hypothetical protein
LGSDGLNPPWFNRWNTDSGQYVYNYQHMPGSFSLIYTQDKNMNDSITMFGSENKINYSDDIISYKQQRTTKTNEYANNILVLQPDFSTLDNPLQENKFNTKDYPIVIAHINSNGDLLLTIMAKKLQSSKETINWFGKVELFVYIT